MRPHASQIPYARRYLGGLKPISTGAQRAETRPSRLVFWPYEMSSAPSIMLGECGLDEWYSGSLENKTRPASLQLSTAVGKPTRLGHLNMPSPSSLGHASTYYYN